MTKKEERLFVYNKFDGHCAYCGCNIDFNNFEIDHIEALRRNDDYGGSDDLNNKFPACLPCNRGKSTFTIEGYRKKLYNMVVAQNRDNPSYRALKRFGLIKETEIKIVFYFESK